MDKEEFDKANYKDEMYYNLKNQFIEEFKAIDIDEPLNCCQALAFMFAAKEGWFNE